LLSHNQTSTSQCHNPANLDNNHSFLHRKHSARVLAKTKIQSLPDKQQSIKAAAININKQTHCSDPMDLSKQISKLVSNLQLAKIIKMRTMNHFM
jgi:hypothetical protein